jgi:hypothetical protein
MSVTLVPADPAVRDDVAGEDLTAFYETAALHYAYGRFDAGDEDLFDEEIEAFALAYARHCLDSGYLPIRTFYDRYVKNR